MCSPFNHKYVQSLLRVGYLGQSRNALAVVIGLQEQENTVSVTSAQTSTRADTYYHQSALRLRSRVGLLALPDINVVLKVLSYLQLSGKAADMNVPDQCGYTPLIIASMCNNVVVVRLLVDAGADKDTVCQMYGYSALHFAAVNNHVEVARLLVKAGADCRVLSGVFRLTALDLALKDGHTEIIQLLSG